MSILSSLLALQRLEQLAEQAYKAVRHRDEATLSTLKAEIDEWIARLSDGKAPRQAAALAYQVDVDTGRSGRDAARG